VIALKVLDDRRAAMAEVGRRYEAGAYFVPELILAGEMLRRIAEAVKPKLAQTSEAAKKRRKVVIGTVQGDIHDIGKNIVTFMLDVNGVEVKDLGVDVPATFVEAVKEFQPQVVVLPGIRSRSSRCTRAPMTSRRWLYPPSTNRYGTQPCVGIMSLCGGQ
jgi:5-methyltetrahydrofolate--homocysteine methyltransferase